MVRHEAGYRLQGLLELRREMKRRREQALVGAAAEQRRCAEAVKAAGRQLSASEQQLHGRREALATVGAPSSAGRLAQQRRFVRRLEQQVAEQRGVVEAARATLTAAEGRLTEARQQLAVAATELEVVERDHQRWDAERRERELKRAEDELEDLYAAHAAIRRQGG